MCLYVYVYMILYVCVYMCICDCVYVCVRSYVWFRTTKIEHVLCLYIKYMKSMLLCVKFCKSSIIRIT